MLKVTSISSKSSCGHSEAPRSSSANTAEKSVKLAPPSDAIDCPSLATSWSERQASGGSLLRKRDRRVWLIGLFAGDTAFPPGLGTLRGAAAAGAAAAGAHPLGRSCSGLRCAAVGMLPASKVSSPWCTQGENRSLSKCVGEYSFSSSAHDVFGSTTVSVRRSPRLGCGRRLGGRRGGGGGCGGGGGGGRVGGGSGCRPVGHLALLRGGCGDGGGNGVVDGLRAGAGEQLLLVERAHGRARRDAPHGAVRGGAAPRVARAHHAVPLAVLLRHRVAALRLRLALPCVLRQKGAQHLFAATGAPAAPAPAPAAAAAGAAAAVAARRAHVLARGDGEDRARHHRGERRRHGGRRLSVLLLVLPLLLPLPRRSLGRRRDGTRLALAHGGVRRELLRTLRVVRRRVVHGAGGRGGGGRRCRCRRRRGGLRRHGGRLR
eukprot:Rhum_TRINITY_DN15125_c8_g1::Rhum_TRINITY_DN15125_c8_g1_i1::g.138184::m.138184